MVASSVEPSAGSRSGNRLLTSCALTQQRRPADALLEWNVSNKKIKGQVLIIVKSAEIEARKGVRQGKQKAPDLQAVLKPAFNTHAVREPGTIPSIQCLVMLSGHISVCFFRD